MARILIEEQHAEKRNEILNVAQRLVYTIGYEQMSIQHIVSELQISKGAFYHYFDSKPALLEAMIERTLDQSMEILLPIVEDPHSPALEKMNRLFSVVGQWKINQKAYMLALLNVWYADDNAIVRQKSLAKSVQRIAPQFTRIIQQGIAEGVFHTLFPAQAGEVVLALMVGSGDNIAARMMQMGMGSPHPAQKEDPAYYDRLRDIQDAIASYQDAIERILGAPAGSIEIITPQVLVEWFDEPPPTPPPGLLAPA